MKYFIFIVLILVLAISCTENSIETNQNTPTSFSKETTPTLHHWGMEFSISNSQPKDVDIVATELSYFDVWLNGNINEGWCSVGSLMPYTFTTYDPSNTVPLRSHIFPRWIGPLPELPDKFFPERYKVTFYNNEARQETINEVEGIISIDDDYLIDITNWYPAHILSVTPNLNTKKDQTISFSCNVRQPYSHHLLITVKKEDENPLELFNETMNAATYQVPQKVISVTYTFPSYGTYLIEYTLTSIAGSYVEGFCKLATSPFIDSESTQVYVTSYNQ